MVNQLTAHANNDKNGAQKDIVAGMSTSYYRSRTLFQTLLKHAFLAFT